MGSDVSVLGTWLFVDEICRVGQCLPNLKQANQHSYKANDDYEGADRINRYRDNPGPLQLANLPGLNHERPAPDGDREE